MDTVYAIFDDADRCVYLCFAYTDEEYEYYEQVEDMNDWDWEEFLNDPLP
jgi:hypothetical protein